MDTNIGIRISQGTKNQLNTLAFEMSTPDKRVTASDVVRQWIDEKLAEQNKDGVQEAA